MDDIQIRLTRLEIKIDKILKHFEGSEKSSSNPYGFLEPPRPPEPTGPPPGKKRPKTVNKKTKKKSK